MFVPLTEKQLESKQTRKKKSGFFNETFSDSQCPGITMSSVKEQQMKASLKAHRKHGNRNDVV